MAKTKDDAITSLHIDMNRKSQVNLDIIPNAYTDLEIPMNIISRFDFIIQIQSDIEKQLNIVLEMAGNEKLLESNPYQFHDPDWKLKIRRMIAYLSTEFNTASINKTTSDYIKNKFRTFIEENAQFGEQLPAMLIRLEISIEKFAKAIACAEMTVQITEKHIDEAFELISYKLEFLKTYNDIEIPDHGLAQPDKVQTRRDLILRLLSGKTLSINEVYMEIESANKSISQRTIYRDLLYLESIGKVLHEKHGQWTFPQIIEDNM